MLAAELVNALGGVEDTGPGDEDSTSSQLTILVVTL
jgi:hypothetical protein